MATTDPNALMRAIYRYVSMWLFIRPELPAPNQVQLFVHDNLLRNADRGNHLVVHLRVADVAGLLAWADVVEKTGVSAFHVVGTSRGHAYLELQYANATFGPDVTLCLACPALPSIPAEVRARVR